MKNLWPKLALLALCCAALAFELWHLRTRSTSAPQPPAGAATRKNEPDFVLLPTPEVMNLARFFAGPKAKIGSWEPTVGDMNGVEANLEQVTELSSKYPDAFRHIENPSQYFRQYGAVLIDGQQAILVNAFCPLGKDKSELWRKHLIVVSDGGKCYWKALFDVSTQKFTKLAVNGIA